MLRGLHYLQTSRFEGTQSTNSETKSSFVGSGSRGYHHECCYAQDEGKFQSSLATFPPKSIDRNVVEQGAFFFLLQSEEGDLFKVTIDHDEEEVQSLKIKYFDTVPVASSLCILKSGFLFVGSEFGNPRLYQFEKLGDDDEEQEFSSTDYENLGAGTEPLLPLATFRPRALENLAIADELEVISPVLDSKVANYLGEDTPQIYTACGRGARSSLRILRQGLEVMEAVSSELPGAPIAVWTTKIKREGKLFSR